MESQEEISEFAESILSSLRKHVNERNTEGVRVESYLFHSAMDEYGPRLSSERRHSLRQEYSNIIQEGGRPSPLEGKL